MTTNSDRNLNHVEAASAGLLPLPQIYKRNSDYSNVDLSKDIQNTHPWSTLLPGEILMKTEAVKADKGKPDWSLVPFEALEEMTKVLEFGAVKYSRWNWTTGNGFKWARVASSTLRHIFAWMRGEDNDPESGLSHIAHAQCNLLFLAYYIKHKNTSKDDRRAS